MEAGKISIATDTDIRHMADCAVAIGYTKLDYFHIGLLYREQDRGIYLLPLPFHYLPLKAGPKPQYVWVFPNLDRDQYPVVAAHCRRLAEQYGEEGLPFAIDYRTYFLDDYSLSMTKPGSGFTCATFVMAIFRLCGIELIDRKSWQRRPDDKDWQQYVIREMEELVPQGRATKEEIGKQKAAKGCYRYRPQEVAASTILGRPATFEEVQPKATEIAAAARESGSIL